MLKQCTICKQDNLYTYVDGKLQRTGSWADMCPSCHSMLGAGLGTGLGQLYAYDNLQQQYIKVMG